MMFSAISSDRVDAHFRISDAIFGRKDLSPLTTLLNFDMAQDCADARNYNYHSEVGGKTFPAVLVAGWHYACEAGQRRLRFCSCCPLYLVTWLTGVSASGLQSQNKKEAIREVVNVGRSLDRCAGGCPDL